MSQHIVTCVNCGKQFDADKDTGCYYERATRRYTCSSCMKFSQKKAAEKERESSTGTKQSPNVMIAKIVIGVLLLVCALIIKGIAGTVISAVIGLALIAWGLVPYFKGKNEVHKRAAEKADDNGNDGASEN